MRRFFSGFGGRISSAGKAKKIGAALLLGALAGAAPLSDLKAQPAPQPPPAAQPRPNPDGPMPQPPSRPGLPPGQPGMQGLPPGHPPMPGLPHGARPGGLDQQRQARPVLPQAAPQKPVEPRKKPEECAGHGPMDAPHHINWWHGMLMVNNERAEKGGFLNSLLFRYHNENNPCDEKNEPPPFLASILNFGVLLYVIARFGKKPVAEALQKRRQTIMGDIDTASRLKAEAEDRLREFEEKFEHIEQTLGELKAEYAAQAEAEKKHILAEAMERRERMKRDAEFRIEQERKSAKVQLLAEAVMGAAKAAEMLIAERATAQDQDRLAEEYLASIPEALDASLNARPEGAQR